MSADELTITFTAKNSDRVIVEIRAVARAFGLHESEAAALIIGFGIRAMKQDGLLPGRASEPIPRSRLLSEMADMIAEAKEFEP